MNREVSNHVRVNGAEPSAQEIRSILEINPRCLSGILGLNDKLEILLCKLFDSELRNLSYNDIDGSGLENVTGIIAFEVIDSNTFRSNSKIINRLIYTCEILGITLIDLMLFGTDEWISLRQQNQL